MQWQNLCASPINPTGLVTFDIFRIISSYVVIFRCISSSVRMSMDLHISCFSTCGSLHTGSIQGLYWDSFPKRLHVLHTVYQSPCSDWISLDLTGSHWISLVPAVSPIAILCLRVNSLRTPCQLPPAPRSAKVLSMLRACSPLRIKSIKHQNEELQPKDANGGHRNRDARCKICSLSLSLKHETTRETQTNFSNLSTSTIH